MSLGRLSILIALIAVALAVPAGSARAQDDFPLERVEASVVKIVIAQGDYTDSDGTVTRWSFGNGSGTVVSSDGLILTNEHVIAGKEAFKQVDLPGHQAEAQSAGWTLAEVNDYGGRFLVQVTRRAGDGTETLADAYWASVVAKDAALDLAVLRVDLDQEGRPVDAATLAMDYLELGDSAALRRGDELRIAGYPGTGGGVLNITPGVVTATEVRGSVENAGLFLTDAVINPGNSGGAAVDESGYLVGVPTFVTKTQVQCPDPEDPSVCYVGGSNLGLVRSINLAEPLLEQALSGSASESPNPIPGTGVTPTPPVLGGGLDCDPIVFATLGADGQLVAAESTAFPAGTLSLDAVTVCRGVPDGTPVQVFWTVNGQDLPLSETTVDQGGDVFLGLAPSDGGPLPDGTYKVRIAIGGQAGPTATATVGQPGGQPEIPPTPPSTGGGLDCDPIVFETLGADGLPVKTDEVTAFPAGTLNLYALTYCQGVPVGTPAQIFWRSNGQELDVVEDTVRKPIAGVREDGSDGVVVTRLAFPDGRPLADGTYEVRMVIGGRAGPTATATVGQPGGQPGIPPTVPPTVPPTPPVLGGALDCDPIRFGTQSGADGLPVPTEFTAFPSGTLRLHAVTACRGVPVGTPAQVFWTWNGQELEVIETTVQEGGVVLGTVWGGSGGPLAGGTYEMRMEVGGRAGPTATATVGQPGGQPGIPPTVPAPSADADASLYRGGPGQTGESPGPGPALPIETLWSFPLGDDQGSGVPTVALGHVYFVEKNGTVKAININTRNEAWSQSINAQNDLPVQIVDSVLYGATADGFVFALDAMDGRPIWTSPETLVYRPWQIIVAEDRIYVAGSEELAVQSLSSSGITPLWSKRFRESMGFVSLAMTGNLLYVATGPYLVAYDTASGEQVWGKELGDNSTVAMSPVVDDGMVSVITDRSLFYLFDAMTGDELWRYSVDDPAYPSVRYAVANGIAVIPSTTDGKLVALNLKTKQEEWRMDVTDPSQSVYESGPATEDGSVLVTEVWYSTPVVVNGVIYVGLSRETGTRLSNTTTLTRRPFAMSAIDLTNGTEVWFSDEVQTQDRGPVVSQGVIYAVGSDGLIAIGNPNQGVVPSEHTPIPGWLVRPPVAAWGYRVGHGHPPITRGSVRRVLVDRGSRSGLA